MNSFRVLHGKRPTLSSAEQNTKTTQSWVVFVFCSIYMMKSELFISCKARSNRTRGARGDFVLLRTLRLRGDAARLAASLHSAPKPKNFSLQLLFRWRGLGRSRQKMERKILCFGFAASSSQKTSFAPFHYYTLIY